MNEEIVQRFIGQIRAGFAAQDPVVESRQLERSHIEVLASTYELVSSGDLARVLECMTEDVELDIVGPADMPFVGRWFGRAAVGAALSRNFGQVKEQTPHIQCVVAQGFQVVLVAREQGVYLPTKRRYDLHWIQIYEFRDGKIARIREMLDSVAWAQATGYRLPEPQQANWWLTAQFPDS